MLQRCENPRDRRFKSYGGRGIRVCRRWHDFVKWLADVGPRPPGVGLGGRALYSLDRQDNDGNYEPGNVVWSTARQQGRRTTRSRLLTSSGVTRPLCEWAELLGVHHTAILNRLQKMSVEEALTKPFRPFRGRRAA